MRKSHKPMSHSQHRFIQRVLSRKGSKGALHRALGVPSGKKIPASKMNKALHAGGKLGRMARFAKTLGSFHKK